MRDVSGVRPREFLTPPPREFGTVCKTVYITDVTVDDSFGAVQAVVCSEDKEDFGKNGPRKIRVVSVALAEKLSHRKFQAKESHSPNFRVAISFPKMLADLTSHYKRQICPLRK